MDKTTKSTLDKVVKERTRKAAPRKVNGPKFPATGWRQPTPTTTAWHEVPAAFKREQALAFAQYEADMDRAFTEHTPAASWNAKGLASPRSQKSPYQGAAHTLNTLVTEELAQWWTEDVTRHNMQQFIIAAWDAQQADAWGDLNARLTTHARTLAWAAGEQPVGTIAEFEGFLWEATVDGWVALVEDVDGTPTPRDPATYTGFTIERFASALAASGTVTATMIDLLTDTYVNGKTGRKGRVIAPAGDLDAAIARAMGTPAIDTKRGAAIAAARQPVKPLVITMAGGDEEPF